MNKYFTQLFLRDNDQFKKPRQQMSPRYAIWSSVSATLGILAIFKITNMLDHPLLIGSFGASAAFLFNGKNLSLTELLKLVGGHVVSAVVAVLVVALVGSTPLAMALGVGFAIIAMHLTHTTHSPGGATAFIGVQGAVGPGFILMPVLVCALILLATAMLTNLLVFHHPYAKE